MARGDHASQRTGGAGLTRQSGGRGPHTYAPAAGLHQGGYSSRIPPIRRRALATGSEVELILGAYEKRQRMADGRGGIEHCLEYFAKQPRLIASVLRPVRRIAFEAAAPQSWYPVVRNGRDHGNQRLAIRPITDLSEFVTHRRIVAEARSAPSS